MPQHPVESGSFVSAEPTRAVVEAFFARQRAGDSAGLLGLFADRVDFLAPGAPNAADLGPDAALSAVSRFFATLDKVFAPDEDFLVLGQDAVVTGFACGGAGDGAANPIALRFTVTGGRIERCHLTEVSAKS
ncbi:nuclear transport factor 2 family protein [Streptomyces sp. BR1]|uniref:nuclear transport factor 2 family protein n=1 Tax=Streptomyces sp. BR1 TaxID=1592323 RepID=UPI00402B3FFB